MGVICGFRNEFRFLSNFWPAKVKLGNPSTGKVLEYPTVEHAYQAAKTLDDRERRRIQSAKNPGQAKKIGRTVELRADWEDTKLGLMYRLVKWKFTHDSELREGLLATGDVLLVELNDWGDSFWGVSRGVGLNHLGEILMRVRKELREEVCPG